MSKKRNSLLALLLILTMLFSTITAIADESDARNVTRISGKNRYQTAINISKNTFETSKYALITNGNNFPDALVGGQLAVQLSAPILTITKDQVPEDVLKELDRIKVETVFILGGINTIDPKVEETLKDRYSNVIRLAGSDRYETAWEIIKAKIKYGRPESQPEGTISGDAMAYVSGTLFADALSAAPFIGQRYDKEPNFTIKENLALAKPGEQIDHHRIIGGESSVQGNPSSRVAGLNRYGTAVELAKLYPAEIGKEIDTVVLVNGEDFPDALASAPLVASKNAVLLLTPSTSLAKETKMYIEENNIKNIIIIGGENSVSNGIESILKNKEADDSYPDIIRIVEDEVKVLEVVDPYTIIADVDGREEIFKMIGVSSYVFAFDENDKSPEKDNCQIDALSFVKEQLEGKKVKLTFETKWNDEYDRALANIWLNDTLFNETIIKEGLAMQKSESPNLLYEQRLVDAMKEARDNKKGIWSDKCSGNPNYGDDPVPSPTLKAHLFSRPMVIGEKSTMKYYKLGHSKFKEINYGDAELFGMESLAIKAGYTLGE